MNGPQMTGAAAIQTRTIEESIQVAHKLVDEAHGALASLRASLTGYGQEQAYGDPIASGIQGSADNLASRLQSFVMDLHATGALVASPNVASLAKSAGYAADNQRYG